MKKSRKAQEEMIGFVLIIVLVSIIALVFLAISIRKPVSQESFEIKDFLQAAEKTSTDCRINQGETALNMAELTKSCLNSEICLDGTESCEILNKSWHNILENSWNVCNECPTSSYKLWIESNNNTKLELSKGNCSGIKEGNWHAIPDIETGKSIITNFEICTRSE